MILHPQVPRFTPKARTALAAFVRAFEAPNPVLVVSLEPSPSGGGLPDLHLQLVPGETNPDPGMVEQPADPVSLRFEGGVRSSWAGLEIDFADGITEGGAPGFLVRTAGPSGSRAPGPSSTSPPDPALVQIRPRRDEPLPAPAMPAFTSLPEASLDPDAVARLSLKLRSEIKNRVNPLVESHGGAVGLVRLRPDAVAEVAMAGGCQGCASAAGTLQEVVARILRKAVPELRGVEDVTLHEKGTNPFYAPA